MRISDWSSDVCSSDLRHNTLLVDHIDALRQAVAKVKAGHPFVIHAWVVLPDHLHCIIELPPGDANYALRWRLIKQAFSKSVPVTEYRSATRQQRQERGIWQRRYWNTLSAMRPIFSPTWIMCISTRSSMDMCSVCWIGHIPPSIGILHKTGIPLIGVPPSMTSPMTISRNGMTHHVLPRRNGTMVCVVCMRRITRG